MNVIYKLLYQSQNFNANSILYSLQDNPKLSEKDISICLEILSHSTSEIVVQLILKELLSILEEERTFRSIMLLTSRQTTSTVLDGSLKLLERSVLDISKLATTHLADLAKALSSTFYISDHDEISMFAVRLVLKYSSSSEVFADEFMQCCNQDGFAKVFGTRNVLLRTTSIQAVQKLLESSFRRGLVTPALSRILMSSFRRYCYGETSIEWLALFVKFTATEVLAKGFLRRDGLRVILSMLKIKHMDIVSHAKTILKNLAGFGLIEAAQFAKSTRQQLINFLSLVNTKERKKPVIDSVQSTTNLTKGKEQNVVTTLPTAQKTEFSGSCSSSESLPDLPKNLSLNKPSKKSVSISVLNSKADVFSTRQSMTAISASNPIEFKSTKNLKERAVSNLESLTLKSMKKLPDFKSSTSLKQSTLSLNKKFSEMSVNQLETEVEDAPDPKVQMDEELQTLVISLIGGMKSDCISTRLDSIYQLQRIVSSTGKEPMQQVLLESEIIAKLVELIGGYNLLCIEHALWALLPFCNSHRRAKDLADLELIPKLAVVQNTGIENIRVYCQSLLKKLAEYGGNRLVTVDEGICKEMDFALQENPWALVSKKWIDYSSFSSYAKLKGN
ncbi:hypothetical protein HDV01_001748 [Terramyces sp. JEL0728]|nr:hypothetical protein HDV01_001748 [Terramyces sp. JEL0728]